MRTMPIAYAFFAIVPLLILGSLGGTSNPSDIPAPVDGEHRLTRAPSHP